jgi:hypothetical protein
VQANCVSCITVVPAKAGTHFLDPNEQCGTHVDSRFRGNDDLASAASGHGWQFRLDINGALCGSCMPLQKGRSLTVTPR